MVFPDPDGPISARKSPCGMSRSRPEVRRCARCLWVSYQDVADGTSELIKSDSLLHLMTIRMPSTIAGGGVTTTRSPDFSPATLPGDPRPCRRFAPRGARPCCPAAPRTPRSGSPRFSRRSWAPALRAAPQAHRYPPLREGTSLHPMSGGDARVELQESNPHQHRRLLTVGRQWW